MAISTTISYKEYAGNGTGPYPITFSFDLGTDVKVAVKDAAGTVTELTYTTEYVVSGANVNTIASYDNTNTIQIRRETVKTQGVGLLSGAPVNPNLVEEQGLDRLTLMIQEAHNKLGTVLRGPLGEAIAEMGDAAARAGRVLAFDGSGEPYFISLASVAPDQWSGTTSYLTGDLTMYSGFMWKALQNSTGEAPAEGVYWTEYGGISPAVILNTTHRTSAGTDHSDVGLNNTHRTSAGTDHSDVGLNNTHRTGDGSDHADVAENTADIADIRTTTGTADEAVNMGVFTGTVLTDNTTVKANLQELGTAVDLNTAKVTNANHTGEVTGSAALTIASNIVDEDNLKITAGTDGEVMVKKDSETGDLIWDDGTNLSLTADHNTNDTIYVAMVMHGTDATPPTASTVPRGTIYIQYTA